VVEGCVRVVGFENVRSSGKRNRIWEVTLVEIDIRGDRGEGSRVESDVVAADLVAVESIVFGS
jgi:hypothetical protein